MYKIIITVLLLVYKSFCNTVCRLMVMETKLVVAVVVVVVVVFDVVHKLKYKSHSTTRTHDKVPKIRIQNKKALNYKETKTDKLRCLQWRTDMCL